MTLEELKGHHRIALLGLGIENEALGEYLRAAGLAFSVRDASDSERVRRLREQWGPDVTDWRIGGDYLERLTDFETLFRTPGLSPLHPALAAAAAAGTAISSQTRLFLSASPAPVLGVTGTKGKGTTASFIQSMLKAGPYRQVRLGGNIGTPPISFAARLRREDLAIVELSSFQLQDVDRSPDIAVVTNVGTDHLDYHAERGEYVDAKRGICRYQSSDAHLVLNADSATARSFATDGPARVHYFSLEEEVDEGAFATGGRLWLREEDGGATREICSRADVPLPGVHNVANVLAAAVAASVAGAPVDQIAAAIPSLKGLPHRLETVAEVDGVVYCDDSLATTPDAALAAMRSFDAPIHLIAGGSSKGADFSELGAGIVSEGVSSVLLLGDEADTIAAAIGRAGEYSGLLAHCGDMAEAVAVARSRARRGDVILLSPGCASFGQFANYAERGEQFTRCVLAG